MTLMCIIFLFNTTVCGLEFDVSPVHAINYQVEIKKNDNSNPTYKIISFDISNSSIIAIGMANGVVDIFDMNMNFLYEYSIGYLEEEYCIEWENNDLIIYNLRYKFAQKINMEGDVVCLYSILDTYKNVQIRNQLNTKPHLITFNNINYIQDDTTIVQKNNDEVTILFDITKNNRQYELKNVILIVSFVAFILIIIILMKKIGYLKVR